MKRRITIVPAGAGGRSRVHRPGTAVRPLMRTGVNRRDFRLLAIAGGQGRSQPEAGQAYSQQYNKHYLVSVRFQGILF